MTLILKFRNARLSHPHIMIILLYYMVKGHSSNINSYYTVLLYNMYHTTNTFVLKRTIKSVGRSVTYSCDLHWPPNFTTIYKLT